MSLMHLKRLTVFFHTPYDLLEPLSDDSKTDKYLLSFDEIIFVTQWHFGRESTKYIFIENVSMYVTDVDL